MIGIYQLEGFRYYFDSIKKTKTKVNRGLLISGDVLTHAANENEKDVL